MVSLNNKEKRTPVEWAEHNVTTMLEGCKTLEDAVKSVTAYEILRQKISQDLRVNTYNSILEQFGLESDLED